MSLVAKNLPQDLLNRGYNATEDGYRIETSDFESTRIVQTLKRHDHPGDNTVHHDIPNVKCLIKTAEDLLQLKKTSWEPDFKCYHAFLHVQYYDCDYWL